MKLPIAWLREFVSTPLPDNELADSLTMAGLEVEEILPSDAGPVFHTKVTPNRGDWMSVLGSAREASAALDVPLAWNEMPLPDEVPDVQRWIGVRVEAPSLCPRYAGKVIRNVRLGPSPEWMQTRLTAAGMRPVNAVVDITNYVMLEMGQPLHAFDYDRLAEGQIVVRTARDGETMATLDGVERQLSPEMLLICDAEKPVAIAGIMGGASSEVSAQTRHVFLESAYFDAGSIRRTSKALGLSTEASYRYERSIDPSQVTVALERASELLADLAGGEVVLGRIDLYPTPHVPKVITLRPARVNAILGTTLDNNTIAHSLRRLGLVVNISTDAWPVTIPTFRPDLTLEIDLIEEVGRMVGYATLPETLPPARDTQGGVDDPHGLFASQMRMRLTGMGFQEALTNSLVSPSPFDGADADWRVTIRQALSAELSGLRVSLVPNLLEALARNLRLREPDVCLFETGKVFRQGAAGGAYLEQRRLAVVATGAATSVSWETPHPPAIDFFTLKGVAETLGRALRLPTFTFTPSERAQMHTGRCATIYVNGQEVGFVAEVDPHAAAQELKAPPSAGRIAVLELDADALQALQTETPRYETLPRFPGVSRDLAVVVKTETPYALLEEIARAAADPFLLESVSLVSVYTGERVPAGEKSVALRLVFRAQGHTLTDAEADAQIDAVRRLLGEQAGAIQR